MIRRHRHHQPVGAEYLGVEMLGGIRALGDPQALHRARVHELRLNVELVPEFDLPLLGKVALS